MKNLTDKDIDSVLKSDRTFLVLFQNFDAPNTENLDAIFSEFEDKFQGKIDVYVCDYLKQDQKISKYFKMNVLPAMVLMRRNKAYANLAGPISAARYKDTIATGILTMMKEDEELDSILDNEYTI